MTSALDALLGQDLGGLLGYVGHAGVSAEGDVLALAADVGLADGDAVVADAGSLTTSAVEQNVLDEHDRVVEFAAGTEQADDVAWSGRSYNGEAGDGRVHALEGLGVGRAD